MIVKNVTKIVVLLFFSSLVLGVYLDARRRHHRHRRRHHHRRHYGFHGYRRHHYYRDYYAAPILGGLAFAALASSNRSDNSALRRDINELIKAVNNHTESFKIIKKELENNRKAVKGLDDDFDKFIETMKKDLEDISKRLDEGSKFDEGIAR